MSTGIIIATHGLSSIELLKSAELISGKQEKVETITFELGQGLECLEKQYKDAINNLSFNDDVLILVDMIGGSPFNIASKFDYEIISGVNIPILLEIFMNRETKNINQLIDQIVTTGKDSITRFSSIHERNDDEEF